MAKKIILTLIFMLFVSVKAEALKFGPDNVNDYIKSTEIIGEIISPAVVHRQNYEKSGRICLLPVGEKVKIIRDSSEKWYYIFSASKNEHGWIKRETLSIPEDEPTDSYKLSRSQLEEYANANDFRSWTNYLVLTDTSRQLTHVFEGSAGNWSLIRTLPCATGKNVSPTLKGTFTIQGRGEWFFSERLNSGAMYWVRFSGPYLFHSIAMDKDGKIVDGVVLEKRSSGCVRFLLEDAKWFYENIPDNTTAVIK